MVPFFISYHTYALDLCVFLKFRRFIFYNQSQNLGKFHLVPAQALQTYNIRYNIAEGRATCVEAQLVEFVSYEILTALFEEGGFGCRCSATDLFFDINSNTLSVLGGVGERETRYIASLQA